MFLGAVEVRGSHEKFGLSAEDVAGHLAGAVRPGPRHDGPSVISHEILGGAEPEEIAAALAPLAGLDVDVVVTARDLGRQATAHWQEEVKLGDTRSFADFEREQFRADVPAGRQASGRTSGTPRTTPRRCAAGRPRCPASGCTSSSARRPGPPPDLLWRRFADACGITGAADGVVDPPPSRPPTPR